MNNSIPITHGVDLWLGTSIKDITVDLNSLLCKIVCNGHDNPNAALTIIFPTVDSLEAFVAFVSCWYYRKYIKEISISRWRENDGRQWFNVVMDNSFPNRLQKQYGYALVCVSDVQREAMHCMLSVWKSIARDLTEIEVRLHIPCACANSTASATFSIGLHPQLKYGYGDIPAGTLFAWVFK